jgi:molecular chaperone GrpE
LVDERSPADFSEATENTQSLRQDLAEERAKAERYLSNWQRAEADLANYQRRTDKEKAEIAHYTIRCVLQGLLPVVDDMDLAVASAPAEAESTEWMKGILLIQKKLMAFLESQGVKPIAASGKPFDPKYHEAVMRSDGEEGLVLQDLRRGYVLNDSVLRPSLVVVGKGRPVAAPPEPPKRDNNEERATRRLTKEEANG